MSQREKVVIEDWFRKRGGKGSAITTKVSGLSSTGKRRYFVLSDRYLDWFDTPKGQRKGTVALENIYVRFQPDSQCLVVGLYGKPNEFKMIYDGPDPERVLQEWYSAITKAIDDFKKRGLKIRMKRI